MLSGVPDTPAAHDAIEQALRTCARLGVPGDLDRPGQDTLLTQLALVTVGVASARALIDDSGVTVHFVDGHSVGAFAAAVVAGVLTLPDALAAVHLRATSMQSVCDGRSWGMAAITGLPIRAVDTLVTRTSTASDPLWVANINSATQTVVGGTSAAFGVAEGVARDMGARGFERLAVDIASHGPLQEPTAAALRARLAALRVCDPTLRYVTNTGGRAVDSAAQVLGDLAESVMRPVRWYDGVRLIHELGVDCAVEMTPGHTLTRLVATAVPDMVTVALDDVGLSVAAGSALRAGRARPDDRSRHRPDQRRQ